MNSIFKVRKSYLTIYHLSIQIAGLVVNMYSVASLVRPSV